MAPLYLTANARHVLEARYLRRDADGTLETPEQLFWRVARAVAAGETRWADRTTQEGWQESFHELLTSLDFLPNTPTLMNAGTPLALLSACFVLPVEDSIESIFDALKLMAQIQQSGGGTGFAFSRLRPRGDLVRTTGGTASGPVSFMRIFDCATENIRQGGKRRGANMGVMRVSHPDVLEFIDAKGDGQSFRNFNISVAVNDDFMRAVADGGMVHLRHPATGDTVRSLGAREVFERLARAAHATGDPGMIFLDAINRAQPTPELGLIEATNPCGEVPLLPYEACNLGSINLSHMTRASGSGFAIDWEKLARTTRLATRFLDDVIEVSRWPSPRVSEAVRGNRKIGLGVMGFADMLIQLGVSYASDQAVQLAGEVMRKIAEEATGASRELALERGVFPNWEHSVYAHEGVPLRNATRTSIAPTGTIGIIAGTSAGIEPLFALAYRRMHVLDEATLTELNPLFAKHAPRFGLEPQSVASELSRSGSLAAAPEVPPAAREVFRTALEIAPEHHLRIQAAFQKYCDNAVSKTINLPAETTAETIADIYLRAWEIGAKGVTVYRYGSKREQVLNLGTEESGVEREHYTRCDPEACRL
jgi:ribonucleoside-diphosphate reductase alpha chain